jgi:hypothetical protein
MNLQDSKASRGLEGFRAESRKNRALLEALRGLGVLEVRSYNFAFVCMTLGKSGGTRRDLA